MHVITLIETLLILNRTFPSFFSKTPLGFIAATSPFLSRIRVTDTFLIGSLLIYLATLIRLACYRALGRHFTFQLAILSKHKLVTCGPYSVVRHPSYTASVVFNIAVVLCQVGAGSWLREIVMRGGIERQAIGAMWICAVTTVSFLLVGRVPKEDMVLRKEFGAEWDRWAEKTKYRLLPGIY